MSTDANIVFKEWLPDLPELGNPGLLEARNVIPGNGDYYEAFQPLTTIVTAGAMVLSERPRGAFYPHFRDSILPQTSRVIAAISNRLFVSEVPTGFTAASATLSSSSFWNFAQFDDLVIAAGTNVVPQQRSLSNAADFTALATSGVAPKASQIGVINRFVVLGNTTEAGLTYNAHRLQWSAIDDPNNWPTPNSATAVATQAGEQFLHKDDGAITAIVGGDQFGIVFQESGVTRLTYVGGSVVFQFDPISRDAGCFFPNGAIQVGGAVFFIARDGIYVTDGVSAQCVSHGKMSKWFWQTIDAINGYTRVYAGHEPSRSLIYWSFPSLGVSGDPDLLLIYNYIAKKFSWANQAMNVFVRSASEASLAVFNGASDYTYLMAFNSSHDLSRFNATAGSAIFTTGEIESNPGGYAFVSGVKPLVDVTANAVTVALGTRNNLSDSATFSAESTANSRSGFCGFRSEARYHRARITVAGTFNSAQGIEVDAVLTGQT